MSEPRMTGNEKTLLRRPEASSTAVTIITHPKTTQRAAPRPKPEPTEEYWRRMEEITDDDWDEQQRLKSEQYAFVKSQEQVRRKSQQQDHRPMIAATVIAFVAAVAAVAVPYLVSLALHPASFR
jgi:hypothetical protein